MVKPRISREEAGRRFALLALFLLILVPGIALVLLIQSEESPPQGAQVLLPQTLLQILDGKL